MPVAEDERGTYIFNSKDLCMIEHIPALVKANISSLKIEGRMKSINYVASTVKVYREAIDAYYDCPDTFRVKDEWLDQLLSIGNRDYCTGFFLNDPDQVVPNYSHDRPLEGHLFIGKVLESAGGKKVTVDVRNKLYNGDNVEIICKKRPLQYDKIEDIIDESGQSVPFAQPGSKVTILFNNDYMANDLIRTTDTGE